MRHTLSLVVSNKSGVLARIAGLFARRGYNIESLTVAPMENEGFSRMTILLEGDDNVVEQIAKQLYKLIDVIKVFDYSQENIVERQLVLIKTKASGLVRSEILQIINIFRSRVVDLSKDTLTVEVTGDEEKVYACLNLLKPYGIIEVLFSGRVVMKRG
jgi:acetolactate synthase-1/3 small subunit